MNINDAVGGLGLVMAAIGAGVGCGAPDSEIDGVYTSDTFDFCESLPSGSHCCTTPGTSSSSSGPVVTLTIGPSSHDSAAATIHTQLDDETTLDCTVTMLRMDRSLTFQSASACNVTASSMTLPVTVESATIVLGEQSSSLMLHGSAPSGSSSEAGTIDFTLNVLATAR
jgi:hypothetical protein